MVVDTGDVRHAVEVFVKFDNQLFLAHIRKQGPFTRLPPRVGKGFHG